MKAERRTTQPGTARKPALRELRGVPALELGIDLIPPDGFARPARDHAHVVEAERKQYRFLQPLIDLPLAIGLSLGDASAAGIEQVQRGIHRFAHGTFGLRADLVTAFESLVDNAG